ncbi:Monoacylglycerol lipase abhd2 [Pleodorina starrii]|uniref:Monoacylglycerol lipase abhd2 n=1 Tax=Pleodorina starrii TaxID=330485 RepID=A0A9W6F7A9_9CHLO|nr:Monoacylglycerol lipase abhd2 [Pleodorina starrii]GLC58455.1 Monoacylglycerol lipase abhd2 [Pleodorina starrii]GLC77439.1 Monoacylglycerol lipase abhd2 [Pleodorina starrii]
MTLSRSSSVIIVSLPEAAQGFRRKGWLPVPNTDWHGVACLVALVLQAFLEILISVLTAPFRKIQETPVVTCVEDNDNTSVLQAMPSLRKFVPTWWALGPFAQTVANGSRAVKNATPYTRELTVMSDGVAVALDWKTVDPALPPDAPLVVVCHGLGGHSRTNSCNGVTEALARRGWRVVVYNRRGHGGSSLLASDTATATATAYRHAAANSSTRRASEGDEGGEDSAPSIGGDATPTPTPRGTIRPIPGTGTSPSPSSSSGPVRGAAVSPQVVGRCVLSVKAFPAHVDLDDLRRVVSHVQSRYPAAPKALVGLSAGSNLVVRFQGDCAEESPFVAAASIANGHELTHLTRALLRKPLTDLMLVKFLKEVLYDRFEEVQSLAAAAGVVLDWPRLLAARRIREFEGALTAPLWGFKHVDEYYTANHCCESFKHIRAPLLSLANADDPVIDQALIRYAQEAARVNRHIISVATVRGGHLGWLAGTTARPWMHDVLTEFLSHAFSRQGGAGRAVAGASDTRGDEGYGVALPPENAECPLPERN